MGPTSEGRADEEMTRPSSSRAAAAVVCVCEQEQQQLGAEEITGLQNTFREAAHSSEPERGSFP